uniref:Uncharacterized protein n=2 Tax=Oryza sativa subsp. japonica TaxID=39947 RepID=Q6YRN3_ORYSJ|nr:hypothetical protein [Oryza sativa Japonica Group]BAD10823.1 hypothetical protein [Oryza sativa Japonica Group]
MIIIGAGDADDLMDSEEDVQQLRVRRVVLSTFSNLQKDAVLPQEHQPSPPLRQPLPLRTSWSGSRSNRRRNRPVIAAFHKFVYNNYRYLGALSSLANIATSPPPLSNFKKN